LGVPGRCSGGKRKGFKGCTEGSIEVSLQAKRKAK